MWVDDTPIHSCIYPAMRADGHQITTIEGIAIEGIASEGNETLGENEKLSPMQQAFLTKQGFQCGYCTPGMIMTASKLTCETEAELRLELEGNLCRCTGYEAIIESVIECGSEPGSESGGESGGERSDQTADSKGQVGKAVPKQDGPNLVTGKPVYRSEERRVGKECLL